jgi:hypothetical protein
MESPLQVTRALPLAFVATSAKHPFMWPRSSFAIIELLSMAVVAFDLLTVQSAEPGPGGPLAGIESVTVAASPLVTRAGAQERLALVLELESPGLSNVTVRLLAPEWSEARVRAFPALAKGRQQLEFEVASFGAPLAVTAELAAGDRSREFGPFTVAPPRRWTIYLTQHTHTDIGYTRPQTEILPEHLRYIDSWRSTRR